MYDMLDEVEKEECERMIQEWNKRTIFDNLSEPEREYLKNQFRQGFGQAILDIRKEATLRLIDLGRSREEILVRTLIDIDELHPI